MSCNKEVKKSLFCLLPPRPLHDLLGSVLVCWTAYLAGLAVYVEPITDMCALRLAEEVAEASQHDNLC